MIKSIKVAPFFTLRQAVFFALAGAFFYLLRGRDVWCNDAPRNGCNARKTVMTALGYGAVLAASGGVFWELSRLFPPETVIQIPFVNIPAFSLAWLVNNLGGTLCSAGFEEGLFRCFIPNRLREFKVPPRIADCLAVIAFALAHNSAGPWAVCNAAAAAVLLLAAYRKTRSFPLIVLIHGLYNLGGRAILLFFGQ